MTLIEDPLAADTLEEMSPERQTQVIQVLDEDQAVNLLTLMAADAAADLLGYLAPERATRMLRQVPSTERDLIIELLRFPDDTAGGIMTNQLALVVRRMMSAKPGAVEIHKRAAGICELPVRHRFRRGAVFAGRGQYARLCHC